ncbi:restriction endonuclease subunit S [Paenibacillus ehimensis]|uniref:restriction endonuclease subunit S n=1 Tax=Paenibacillus ehimensis TaxID=79264 RepID=UPI002DB9F617|nr:restriction endonuclease subunit S [Paenibacillus ehimensis]MEC0209859.1 restriction endonuclease subunit S [Paenibacillus ehimensis]
MVNGWDTIPLGEVGSWYGGLTPSMSNPLFWGGSIYWLSSGDVKRPFLNNSSKQITELALSRTSLKCLPKGTIVIVVRSGILRVNLPVAELQTEMAINQDLKGIIVHESILSRYIMHTLIFHGEQILKTCLKSGTTVESIELKWLKEFEIPLPPLPEQQAIAVALSDVDGYITSLEKLITKKKAIKQGAMQELLTGKRRLPGFDGEWKEKSLLDLGTIIPGLTYKPENVQTHGLLVLRSSNIHQERLVFDDCVFVDCEVNSNQYVKKGDILICVRNGSSELIGKCAFIDKDYRATFGAFMSVFRSQYAKFIFQVFRSDYVQKQIRNNSNATINQITKKDFENLVVPVPPTLTEQSAIADVLSDMDSEIEALIAKLHKAKLLKKGMMQELLTGRIRLVQPEAAAVVTEKPKLQVAATSSAQKVHNRQFDDAVMIAGIVNAFYSARYPLGRKKVQKLLYLLRRKLDESIVAFKKKAAGPYADEVRYKGGEPIANRNRYIATMTIKGKGTTFTPGENIGQALDYIERWGRQSDIQWLAEKFRYTSVDDLELLATVDMAICDLEEAGIPVSVASIKHLIATNKEWQAKLQKKTFADSKIAKAISDLQTLL